MSRIQHFILQVNSEEGEGTNSTATDFDWNSPVPVNFPKKVNGKLGGEWVYSVRPENILIPHSFYNVTSANNTLNVTEVGGSGGGGSLVITIGTGNYSMTNFILELVSELNLASTAEDNNTYSALFDDVQGKLSFSYTGTSTSVSFDLASTSFPILGLTEGVNHSFTVAAPLIAQNVSFLNKTRRLHLSASGGISLSNFYDRRGITNNIARIPILADPFTDNFIPNDRGSNFFRINPIGSPQKFHFQLKDESGSIVDLNGENFQFDLVFYKRRS